MKVTGIIAEYNPFHNGHAYHMQEARRQTGADYLIIAMSGNFVQRGTPAIIDKYTRTRMALEAGADLVLELPTAFATASAELFSQAAVSLFNHLGIVSQLCFGCEHASLPVLSLIANILIDEPEEYRQELKLALRQGYSYPRARYQALIQYLLHNCENRRSVIEQLYELASHLSSPNNILGIEYLKALIRTSSSIKPLCIERRGSSYHADELSEELSSATAIRTALASKMARRINGMNGVSPDPSENFSDGLFFLRPHMPASSFALLEQAFCKTFPVFDNDFSAVLDYALLTLPELERFADVSPELASRIQKQEPIPMGFEERAESLKTKNITRTRINRALLHTLLGIQTTSMDSWKEGGCCFYARILGFREASEPLLAALKENANIPLLSKPANAKALLSPEGQALLDVDFQASRLYGQAIFHKYGHRLPNDCTAGILRI